MAAQSPVLPPLSLGGASGKAAVDAPLVGLPRTAPQSGCQRLEVNYESSVAQNGQLLGSSSSCPEL